MPSKTMEEFLATVPDAPSAAVPGPPEEAEPAEDEATPKVPPTTAETSSSKSSAAPSTKATAAPSTKKLDGPALAEAPAFDKAAVIKALREGDLDTVGELLEEDPSGFDEKTPKWAARNRREAKLKAENAAVLAKAEAVVSRFAPAEGFFSRIQAGDFSALPELVEHLGQNWDAAAMSAFRARRAADPRVPQLQARVAELEPVAEERKAARAAAADKAFYETLRDEVDVKDVVRKLPDWEAKVADVLRGSLDPETGDPKLSTKQAAARVVRKAKEQADALAKVFEPEDKPRRTRAATPERAAGASGTTKRRLTRDEWLAARGNQ